MEALHIDWELLGRTVGIAAGIVAGVLILHAIVFRGLGKLGKHTPVVLVFDGTLLEHSRRPLRLLLPILALYVLAPTYLKGVSEAVVGPITDLLYILLIVALAWLLIKLTEVLQTVVAHRYRMEGEDNLAARKVRTQVDIIRRILIVGIVILALGAILMHYESFRELGTGLLASAGVVGIIIGFAAQRTLGNLLAGIQIAITQPIRVDDVVVVEGEWGRIEEITLTYVVVRIWDLRRLVLPISYFIEKPFQNWTRTSASILGTVFLYVDYTVPFDTVRDELERQLQSSEYWDGHVWRLHVTDAKENTVEIRALMSAADSAKAFELRAEIREKLIAFLQREYPGALPKVRAEIKGREIDDADVKVQNASRERSDDSPPDPS